MALEIIVIRESFADSIKSDVSTFGFLMGSAATNHWLLGDSAVVNVIVGLMIVMFLFGKLGGKGRMTPEQAIAHIEQMRAKP